MSDRHWPDEHTPDYGHGADEMTPREQERYRGIRQSLAAERARELLASECSTAADIHAAEAALNAPDPYEPE